MKIDFVNSCLERHCVKYWRQCTLFMWPTDDNKDLNMGGNWRCWRSNWV